MIIFTYHDIWGFTFGYWAKIHFYMYKKYVSVTFNFIKNNYVVISSYYL